MKAGDPNPYKPNLDFGSGSNMQSLEEPEGGSILKVSRYPEEIAEDFKNINSYEASIENDIETVHGPATRTPSV